MKLSLRPWYNGFTEGLTSLTSTNTMLMKKYEFTIKVKTPMNPTDTVRYIVQKLKDTIPVLSIQHRLIEDRDTSIEHHGGISEED